ncbi:MAG: hypothetical protein DMG84_01795 [Acidobacteria bacterium]|nr:MAG: hypothetical protein DMG85_19785 [Acidobacteriota bacterium]PYX17894.1 MAG: hypothetical protein DMG84_01795 [Acidobacteriota bacterium]
MKGILVGIAINLIAAALLSNLAGPHFGLMSLTVGFVLLIVAFSLRRGLTIHYAGWGIGPEQYQDVTTVVKGYVRDNKIDIAVENATFQCHPYQGIPKKLFVQYSFGFGLGKKEKTKLEGDRLNLP